MLRTDPIQPGKNLLLESGILWDSFYDQIAVVQVLQNDAPLDAGSRQVSVAPGHSALLHIPVQVVLHCCYALVESHFADVYNHHLVARLGTDLDNARAHESTANNAYLLNLHSSHPTPPSCLIVQPATAPSL